MRASNLGCSASGQLMTANRRASCQRMTSACATLCRFQSVPATEARLHDFTAGWRWWREIITKLAILPSIEKLGQVYDTRKWQQQIHCRVYANRPAA